MEAVFCTDAEQEAIARRLGISAPIVTAAGFYLAEDYHQKYYLRQRADVAREIHAQTKTDAGFVASTVTARVKSNCS